MSGTRQDDPGRRSWVPASSANRPPKSHERPESFELLAVVGTTRSGTTLLDMLLGDTPAVFSGGKPRTIWERDYLRGQPCSNGEPIQRCEFWSEVMPKAFGSVGQPDPAPHQVAEWKRLARRIARSVATEPDLADHPKLRDYRQPLLQLDQTTCSTTMLLDLRPAIGNAIGKTCQLPQANGPETPK
jgi:hypothetical protein